MTAKKGQFRMQFCIIRAIIETKPGYLRARGRRLAHQVSRNNVNSEYRCAWGGKEAGRQPRRVTNFSEKGINTSPLQFQVPSATYIYSQQPQRLQNLFHINYLTTTSHNLDIQYISSPAMATPGQNRSPYTVSSEKGKHSRHFR